MVKIRLRRMGAKKRPFYRVVAADSRTARDGRFIEMLGTYDPNTDPPTININHERVEYWLKNGAQPSDTARGLLKVEGFLGAVAKSVEPAAEPEKPVKEPAKKRAAKAKAAEAEEPKTEEPKTEEPAAEVKEPVAEPEKTEESPAAEPEAADEEKKPKPRRRKAKEEDSEAEPPAEAAEPAADEEKSE